MDQKAADIFQHNLTFVLYCVKSTTNLCCVQQNLILIVAEKFQKIRSNNAEFLLYKINVCITPVYGEELMKSMLLSNDAVWNEMIIVSFPSVHCTQMHTKCV